MAMEDFWMNINTMTTDAENLLNVEVSPGVTVAMIAAVLIFILVIGKISDGDD